MADTDQAAFVRRLERASARIAQATSEDEAHTFHVEEAARFAGPDPDMQSARVQLSLVLELVVRSLKIEHAAVHSREVLLASVCHDLRNPLNTFAMSASLLRGDLERQNIDVKHALSLVDRMDRGQVRMQAIIEDLLEASRIDARAIELVFGVKSAKDVVEEAVRIATPLATEKRVHLVLGALDEAARVRVDPTRMQDLLAKVIAYGMRTTGETGTIRLDVTELEGTVAVDARAMLPTTAQPSVDPHRGGLALLIARGLAAAHGGQLQMSIEDDPDGRHLLVIRITLPAAESSGS